MKLHLLLVATTCTILAAHAQNISLIEVVAAEKSFAADATSIGISEAFMKHLDDSAIVFDWGKIANGKQVWGARKTEGSSLIWYPEFAEASGDLGYSMGPAQFRADKNKEQPDYTGYFNSIWRKNKNGEWKVMLDMGTPQPDAIYNESKVDYDTAAVVEKIKKNNSPDIKKIEEKFIADYNIGKGYGLYGSSKARYFRPRARFSQGVYPSADSVKIQFRNAGTGLSSSGDLGYAYGFANAAGSEGNYLRVWKKEKDKWRIVLDAVTY